MEPICNYNFAKKTFGSILTICRFSQVHINDFLSVLNNVFSLGSVITYRKPSFVIDPFDLLTSYINQEQIKFNMVPSFCNWCWKQDLKVWFSWQPRWLIIIPPFQPIFVTGNIIPNSTYIHQRLKYRKVFQASLQCWIKRSKLRNQKKHNLKNVSGDRGSRMESRMEIH